MIYEVLSPYDRFEPLRPSHPLVGTKCVECGKPLKTGERPSLVNGMPPDSEQMDKALRGAAHTVEAQPAHQRCAYPAWYSEGS